jgi:hypothetical protein
MNLAVSEAAGLPYEQRMRAIVFGRTNNYADFNHRITPNSGFFSTELLITTMSA